MLLRNCQELSLAIPHGRTAAAGRRYSVFSVAEEEMFVYGASREQVCVKSKRRENWPPGERERSIWSMVANDSPQNLPGIVRVGGWTDAGLYGGLPRAGSRPASETRSLPIRGAAGAKFALEAEACGSAATKISDCDDPASWRFNRRFPNLCPIVAQPAYTAWRSLAAVSSGCERTASSTKYQQSPRPLPSPLKRSNRFR